ncbi:MAG TPA: sugar phosphate isomerase/epimerase family protein [Terracidiphilus sp.]|jgi:sugar phosphate isomerase/epimerase|nr:sugar phosphate isomerase/epimerase family protein [Terracidiphilus sp.]
MQVSRREFVAGAAAGAAVALAPRAVRAFAASCPFRVAVINDEISQDFDHACSVAAKDFRLQWIELRGMWNKNLTALDTSQIAESKRILAKYNLKVTDIASPLFKVDWPGAPVSKQSERRDQFNAQDTFKQQDALLEHCIELAKMFGTDRIRCFDFWRLDDAKPYRAAMNDKLRGAARRCAKENLILLLENEMDCNTATGAEAAATLSEVREPNFMLNWDPGNAATFPDSMPYPDGYNLLPKKRIGHCHAKSVIRKPDGKWEWAPVGEGVVDWAAQLQALKRDGYRHAVSLETHWRGAGTPEASTRVSMKGLKDALKQADAGC